MKRLGGVKLIMMCKIDTVPKVKKFTDICNRYKGSVFVYTQEGYIIDGKSIMGMFSINIMNPLRVLMEDEPDEEIIENFYNEIREFEDR